MTAVATHLLKRELKSGPLPKQNVNQADAANERSARNHVLGIYEVPGPIAGSGLSFASC